MNARGYAVSICCDENVSRNIMKNLPLVANKRGICSRNININAIWVWAENTVNSGVLLHLYHQTHRWFGEPPVPTVIWLCACLGNSFWWNISHRDMVGPVSLVFCSTIVVQEERMLAVVQDQERWAFSHWFAGWFLPGKSPVFGCFPRICHEPWTSTAASQK